MTQGAHGSVLSSIGTLFDAGSVSGMTDGQLLDQFLTGSDQVAEVAFAALLAVHGPMVWDVCRGILTDRHAAEDAFQATFLILVRKAGSIRRRDAVGPWLHGVARKVALRAKATAARDPWREAQEANMPPSPAPGRSLHEELEAMHQEIDRLPEKFRAAIVLCHLEGRTHAEVARLLKCPVGTISVRARRARNLLRTRLTRRGVALSVAWAAITPSLPTASAAMPSGLAQSTIKAAMQHAAGKTLVAGTVPATVTQLVKGVLDTMTYTKFASAAGVILVAGSITAGVALLAREEPPANTSPAAAIKPNPTDDHAQAQKRSNRNLRRIALAIYNFASDTAPAPAAAPAPAPAPVLNLVASQTPCLPAAMTTSDEGKPLLSWRVAILPYFNDPKYKALYDKFHLNEPWDSPHNKPLLDELPDVYAPVMATKGPKNSTYYQVFTGPNLLFAQNQRTALDDVNLADGTANTILAVEAAVPVPWTKPEDIPFDKDKPLPALGGLFDTGFHILFADGSVLFASKKTDEAIVRALITPQGGETMKSLISAP